MLDRVRLTPGQTRTRILDVAEEQFRRIGYGKTAVADIARELGMSPANVYRFFPSKGAINEAICRRIMAEADAIVARVAADAGRGAAERLLAIALEHHAFNRAKLVNERRVFDMVEVAMVESWDAIMEHMQNVVGAIARVIADGVARGEFRPVDPVETAKTVKQALLCVMHPSLLAQCDPAETEDAARRIVTLVVDGLGAGRDRPQGA